MPEGKAIGIPQWQVWAKATREKLDARMSEEAA